MSTPVNITVQSDDPSPVLISGVVIQVYVANSVTLVTSGTTNGSGVVTFLLPDGNYDLLFYKQGISILPSQPQRIVVDHTLSNNFLVTAHIFTVPVSINPLLCLVTGFVISGDGTPLPESKLEFFPVLDPIVTSGNIVPSQSTFRAQSDSTGYFKFTVLRGMHYKCYTELQGQILDSNTIVDELDIFVPNQPGIDLASLLYPLPVNFAFPGPTLSIQLANGPDTSQSPTVTYSDQSTRSIAPSWVTINITVADPTILAAAFLQDGKLAITPLRTGTTTITTTRTINATAFFSNPPTYTSGTLTVTVS